MIEQLHMLVARVRELFNKRRIAREMEAEFAFHLECEIDANLRRGLAPDDARRAALLTFGGVQRFREETRAARGFAFLDATMRDSRLAVRRLARSPMFTFGAAATLAIALGAATGIGALVYGVMLRPLPYPDPDRIVQVSVSTPGLSITSPEHSSGTFVFLAERAHSFQSLGAAMENEGIAITNGDTPERVTGAIVTPSLFLVLGTIPTLGRLFTEEDAVADTVNVVISNELWRRRYGSDPEIIGKVIELNRSRRIIVGVLPATFAFPTRAAAVYYPNHITATKATLDDRYLTVVGRLAAGTSLVTAQKELELLGGQMHLRFPDVTADAMRKIGFRMTAQTLRSATTASVRSELTLLSAMIVALLVIAGANVLALCLLRAERLRAEVGVSQALGASRTALFRRFVVEHMLLAILGGAAAIPLAAAAVSARFGFEPAQIPRLDEVTLTPALVIGMLALAMIIGVALGMVALVRASAGSPSLSIREGARSTRSKRWKRMQEALVATQIAVSLALLLAAGLLGSSLLRLQQVNIGFATAHRTGFSLSLPYRAYPNYQRATAFHTALMESLRHSTGITSVAAAMQFPATPQLLYVRPRVQANTHAGQVRQAIVTANVVSPEFFSVMEIPMRSGRTFAPGDLATATPAVVLSASLARELFDGEDPVGQEVRLSKGRYPAYRVIGVSGDVYSDRLIEGPLRTLYFPLLPDLQSTALDTVNIPFVPAGMHFVVQSTAPVSSIVAAVRSAVSTIDPRVPVWDFRSLDDLASDLTARTRLTMMLLGVAAVATLLLSAIGLYGIIAYTVTGRAREFAVRLAIGSTPSGILRLVLREALGVAMAGTAAGIAIALANTRLLRGVLYGVGPADPAIYLGATVVILATAFVASYAPARRASLDDPAKVLRAE